MSDDKPAETPEDDDALKLDAALDSMCAKHEYDAETLKQALDPTARKMGMYISRVVYDGWRFHIWAKPLLPAIRLDLDEEIFWTAKQPGPLLDLVVREMEHLQLRLFDQSRDEMAKLDCRGRVANLSKEDKQTLHEMLNHAYNDLFRDAYMQDPRSEAREKTWNQWRELVGKLFGR